MQIILTPEFMSDIKELDTLDIYWDIFTENANLLLYCAFLGCLL